MHSDQQFSAADDEAILIDLTAAFHYQLAQAKLSLAEGLNAIVETLDECHRRNLKNRGEGGR